MKFEFTPRVGGEKENDEMQLTSVIEANRLDYKISPASNLIFKEEIVNVLSQLNNVSQLPKNIDILPAEYIQLVSDFIDQINTTYAKKIYCIEDSSLPNEYLVIKYIAEKILQKPFVIDLVQSDYHNHWDAKDYIHRPRENNASYGYGLIDKIENMIQETQGGEKILVVLPITYDDDLYVDKMPYFTSLIREKGWENVVDVYTPSAVYNNPQKSLWDFVDHYNDLENKRDYKKVLDTLTSKYPSLARIPRLTLSEGLSWSDLRSQLECSDNDELVFQEVISDSGNGTYTQINTQDKYIEFIAKKEQHIQNNNIIVSKKIHNGFDLDGNLLPPEGYNGYFGIIRNEKDPKGYTILMDPLIAKKMDAEGKTCVGNDYDCDMIDSNIEQQYKQRAHAIAQYLYEHGYTGPVGLDFIYGYGTTKETRDKKMLYNNEANIRTQGNSGPRGLLELRNKQLPIDLWVMMDKLMGERTQDLVPSEKEYYDTVRQNRGEVSYIKGYKVPKKSVDAGKNTQGLVTKDFQGRYLAVQDASGQAIIKVLDDEKWMDTGIIDFVLDSEIDSVISRIKDKFPNADVSYAYLRSPTSGTLVGGNNPEPEYYAFVQGNNAGTEKYRSLFNRIYIRHRQTGHDLVDPFAIDTTTRI